MNYEPYSIFYLTHYWMITIDVLGFLLTLLWLAFNKFNKKHQQNIVSIWDDRGWNLGWLEVITHSQTLPCSIIDLLLVKDRIYYKRINVGWVWHAMIFLI